MEADMIIEWKLLSSSWQSKAFFALSTKKVDAFDDSISDKPTFVPSFNAHVDKNS